MQLIMIVETFSFAEQLAGVALQPAHSVAAPLWAPFSTGVQSLTRRDLAGGLRRVGRASGVGR
eukprot:4667059-Pyramimonas_sp.AAC.1